jgi:hypothetical protein
MMQAAQGPRGVKNPCSNAMALSSVFVSLSVFLTCQCASPNGWELEEISRENDIDTAKGLLEPGRKCLPASHVDIIERSKANHRLFVNDQVRGESAVFPIPYRSPAARVSPRASG